MLIIIFASMQNFAPKKGWYPEKIWPIENNQI
jgi:hypothetical protein